MPLADGTRTVADDLKTIADECNELHGRYCDAAMLQRSRSLETYLALDADVLRPLERVLAMCRATMRDACVLADNGFRPASELMLKLRLVELREERAKIALPGVQ